MLPSFYHPLPGMNAFMPSSSSRSRAVSPRLGNSRESFRQVSGESRSKRSTRNSDGDSYSDSSHCLTPAAISEQRQICLCGVHRGCCRQHNSTQTPIPYHKPSENPFDTRSSDAPRKEWWQLLEAILRRVPRSPLRGVRSSQEAMVDIEKSPLLGVSMGDITFNENNEAVQQSGAQTGYKSEHTLTPIHPIVQCHIALDHLDCVHRRRGLGPGATTIFIDELSSSRTETHADNTSYKWSSEVYYAKHGTFLQRQQIRCYVSRSRENSLRFTRCPYESLQISKPVFSSDGHAQMIITNYPQRCQLHASEIWNTRDGTYAQVTHCAICYSDAECTIQLREEYDVDVRYTCFKDLGSGTKMDLIQSKWKPLLTGDIGRKEEETENDWALPHGQLDHELDVFIRVWNTARALRRSDLYDTEHHTAEDTFKAS